MHIGIVKKARATGTWVSARVSLSECHSTFAVSYYNNAYIVDDKLIVLIFTHTRSGGRRRCPRGSGTRTCARAPGSPRPVRSRRGPYLINY